MFNTALKAAREGLPVEQGQTFAALVEAFKSSKRWRAIKSDSGRRHYNLAFRRAGADFGKASLASLTIHHIEDHIETMASTPSTADICLNRLRILFKWGVPRGHAPHDPTEGIAYYNAKTDVRPWTMDEIARFVSSARREVADVAALAYYTALRKSDLLKLSPEHRAEGHITMQKTKGTATIAISSACAEILDRLELDGLPYLRTSQGKAWGRGIEMAIRRELARLGMDGIGLTLHGLRRSAATFAQEQGATDDQVTALLAHDDARSKAPYVKQARRDQAAREVVEIIPRIPGNGND